MTSLLAVNGLDDGVERRLSSEGPAMTTEEDGVVYLHEDEPYLWGTLTWLRDSLEWQSSRVSLNAHTSSITRRTERYDQVRPPLLDILLSSMLQICKRRTRDTGSCS